LLLTEGDTRGEMAAAGMSCAGLFHGFKGNILVITDHSKICHNSDLESAGYRKTGAQSVQKCLKKTAVYGI
jgi:hypothetical protein